MRVTGTIFTVHEKPDAAEPSERVVLVREGFAFWAFVFHLFWLMAQQCWRMAGLFLLLMLALEAADRYLGLSEIAGLALMFGLQFWLGCVARDAQRAQLARRGYTETGVVCAESELLAERRYFDRQAAM